MPQPLTASVPALLALSEPSSGPGSSLQAVDIKEKEGRSVFVSTLQTSLQTLHDKTDESDGVTAASLAVMEEGVEQSPLLDGNLLPVETLLGGVVDEAGLGVKNELALSEKGSLDSAAETMIAPLTGSSPPIGLMAAQQLHEAALQQQREESLPANLANRIVAPVGAAPDMLRTLSTPLRVDTVPLVVAAPLSEPLLPVAVVTQESNRLAALNRTLLSTGLNMVAAQSSASIEGIGTGLATPLGIDASLSAGLSTNARAVATGSQPVGVMIDLPMDDPRWRGELGSRLMVMANGSVQSAEIKLNPAHLGPIEVRISIEGDQAKVSFSAHHALTRDALESAIPRLREMLGANGLDLLDVNVSEHSLNDQSQREAQQHQEEAESPEFLAGLEQGSREGSSDKSVLSPGVESHLMIDFYA